MPALPAPRDTFVPPPPSPHSPAYQARPSNQTPLRHHASPECEPKYKCPGGTDKVRIDNKRSSKTTMRLTPSHTPRRSPAPPEASPPRPLSPLARAARLASSSPTRRRMPALPAPRDTIVLPPPSPHSPAYQARPSKMNAVRHHASAAQIARLGKP